MKKILHLSHLFLLFTLLAFSYGQCHYTCTNCSVDNSPFDCTSCGDNSVTFRTITASNTCPCDLGYEDTGFQNCVLLNCDYSCATCNQTVSNCASCTLAAQRELVGTECLCKTGYYDDGSNEQCATCHYSCYTCDTTDTNCTSCKSSDFRTKSGTTCPCSTGYYDDSVATCGQCSNKCTTCSVNATNCGTCAGSSRSAAPDCNCPNRKFDDGVNGDCQACHYSCLTCSDSSTCDTCDSSNHRVISTSQVTCACSTGYYDDGTNELCADCYSLCLTCDGATISDCTTCNISAHRQVNSTSGQCVCKDGYLPIDSSTQLCLQCHYSCKTCSSTTNTSCQSCDSTLHRQSDGSNGCPCKDGFYEDSNNICQGCDSSCDTCTDGVSCATCISSQNKVIGSSGLCQCANTTIYNSSLQTCQTCNYQCATCESSKSNCTSCPTSSFRTYLNNKCQCNLYYYDDGSNAVCQACSYKCHTCDSTGCLNCSSTNYRTLSGTECPCDDGYYDDGSNRLCLTCSSSCKTCTNGTECATCQTTDYLTLNSTTKLCECQAYYFQNVQGDCQQCKYTCLSCGNNQECASCDASKFRQMDNPTKQCICMDSYFDDGGNELCQGCLYDCQTCDGPSECLTCNSSLNRENNTDNRCVCIDGYFQNPSLVCQACHYSCVTCSGSTATDCGSCNTTAFRNFIPHTGQCVCKDTYYDAGVQECAKCHYSCETCSASASCSSCDGGTGRSLNTVCDCPTQHFYDDGVTQPCYDCHYSCQTCAQADVCLTCDASKFRQLDSDSIFCECMVAYYDDGLDNEDCKACSYTCKTCTNSTACQTCTTASFRHLPAQSCPCIDKYYDAGDDSQPCLNCQYTCQTCTNLTQCATCDANKQRQYDSGSKLCICLDGFYDNGSDEECLSCIYSCLTCSINSYSCVTCNSSAHRELNGSDCVCQTYYFDDLVNEECQSCHYSCLSCSDNSTCDSCDSDKMRQPQASTDLCKCMISYYDDGFSNQQCAPCEDSCLECVDDTACTDCNSSLFREINTTASYNGSVDTFCVCFYRYYSPSQDAACQPCHYSCEVCEGPNPTDCLYCNATAHRTLDGGQCLCDDGYYDGGSLEICLNCDSTCLVCIGPSTQQCTSCISTHYLFLQNTTCYSTCPSYYYDKDSTMTCEECSDHCLTCVDETQCTQCQVGYPLYEAECLTQCPVQSTWFNGTENICTDCPQHCLTCNSSVICTSCVPDYYLDEPLALCFACHQHCKGCFGPAENQCEDCQYPLYFENNQCFNITCPYGQYIHSHQGCLNCSDLFSNSLTCNITEAFLCTSKYKVKNGVCAYCTSVTGYSITTSGDCSEVCGDGLLLDLQCDDGNTDDGDGCSQNCIIEEGWHCEANNSASVCELDGDVTMTVKSFLKYGGQNKIKIILQLSIPVQLGNFFNLQILTVNSVLYDWEYEQQESLSVLTFIINYRTDISNKSVSLTYLPSRRLLADFNISLAETFPIEAYPPAIYYENSTLSTYTTLKQVIYVLSIVLFAFSLCLIPKKMHLHSVTLAWIPAYLYVVYGIIMEDITDWIKWSLQQIYPLALVGGFPVGDCCTTSEFFQYSTTISFNAGYIVCICVGIWLLYGLFTVIHRKCCKIPKFLLYFRYFTISLQLIAFCHLTFSGLNALSHSSLTSQIGAINVCIGIFVSVFAIAILVTLWALNYMLQTTEEEENEKADATNNSLNQDIHDMKATGSSFLELDAKSRIPLQISSLDTESNKTEEEKPRNQPIKLKKQPDYKDEWLAFDYVQLLKGSKPSQYFLPLFFTKIWLSLVFAAFLQSHPFYFFCVLCFLNLVHIIFMIAIRPFNSGFSNFRLIFMEILFLAMNAIMIYYCYQAQSSQYSQDFEFVGVILIAIILCFAVLFIVMEHILSWKTEIWNKIEPCLISLRLRGRKQVYPLEKKRRVEKLQVEEVREEKKDEDEELDAFFARMIKKENLQRQYRRERMMKEPKRNKNLY